MSIVSGIVSFLIIWWVVLFAVLPFGNKASDNPEIGHATSAPEKPRLWLKAAVTTGISLLLFTIFWLVVEYSGWSLVDR